MTMGDDATTLFWEDLWVSSWQVHEMAPRIHDRIHARTRRAGEQGMGSRMLSGHGMHVGPDLELELLHEYFLVWEAVEHVALIKHVS